MYAPGPPLPSGMRPGFCFFYPGSPHPARLQLTHGAASVGAAAPCRPILRPPPDTPPHQPPCRGPARRDQPAVGRRVDVTADTSRDRRCRRARLPRRLAGRRARRAVRPKPSACRSSRLAATPRPRRRLARPAASASPERSPATAGGTGTDVRGDRPGRSPRSPSSSTTPPRPAAVAAVPWQTRRPPPTGALHGSNRGLQDPWDIHASEEAPSDDAKEKEAVAKRMRANSRGNRRPAK